MIFVLSFSRDVPVCAAVACLCDVHYGSVIEELATLFYLLPEPIVRSTYLVFMLQNYCHVLTLTLEMLNIEWEDKFRSELDFQRLTSVPEGRIMNGFSFFHVAHGHN